MCQPHLHKPQPTPRTSTTTLRGLPARCILLLGLLAVPACATQHVNLTMQAPAAVNLKARGVAVLAVTTFEGPGDLGKKVSEAVTVRLVESQHLRVVERGKLLALEQEQVLGMTGVVDASQAAKVGKVLGADALLLARVTPHPGQARLAIAYRVIKTDTGEILAARQVHPALPDAPGRHHWQTDEAAKRELLNKLAEAGGRRLAAELVPHPVKVEREFENGGWFFGDAEVKQGIEYVKADRPEDAIAQWEEVARRRPDSSAAYYNLGIAYELLSHFDKAERAYRAAEKIDPKPQYIQAVSHVKTMAESHRKLEEETALPMTLPAQ